MKSRFFKAILLVIVVLFAACSSPKVDRGGDVTFTSQLDSVSYALGFLTAKSVKQNVAGPFDSIDYKVLAQAYVGQLKPEQIDRNKQNFDTIDMDIYYKGFFNEMAENGISYFNETLADGYLRQVYQNVQAKKQADKVAQGQANIEKGKAFLENNKLREEVIETASGLQYEVIKKGTGAKPSLKDRVKCYYTGTLLDGTQFDGNKGQEKPMTFGVGGVIKGWTEALQLMPVGSIYKLYIPSELAYGPRGSGAKIGANETLIFEVELVDIAK